MKWKFTLIFSLFTLMLAAQSRLELSVVEDLTKVVLIGATVQLYQDSTVATGAVTDFQGIARLKLPAGTYRLEVHYLGFETSVLHQVEMEEGKTKHLVVEMKDDTQALQEVVISYQKPLIQQDNTSQRLTISSERIQNLPVKNVNAVAASSAGVASGNHQTSGIRNVPSVTANSRMETPKVRRQAPAAGQLTAGHWRDIDNQQFWTDILGDDMDEWKHHWQLFPHRVSELELVNREGLPLIDAEVFLYSRSEPGRQLWRGRTDNRGKVALWDRPFTESVEDDRLRAEVRHHGRVYPLDLRSKEGVRQKKFKVDIECEVAPVVDLLFAIDVSGSMKDELSFLKSELIDVTERLQQQHTDKTIRTGAICYQSPGDPYLTKESDFASDAGKTADFFSREIARGGKGGAEAVEQAFLTALELDWSEQAVARILFILLDEPPEHDDLRRRQLAETTREMARRGIKVVPVVSSGAKRDLEFLMRSVSVMTNGTYVFLTDHSGIGDAHLEPITDTYEVFKLNDLLVKVVNDFTEYEACEPIEEQPVTDSNRGVKIFPNPATDVLNIEFPGPDFQVSVYNSTGQLVGVAQEQVTRIDLSDFPAGTYYLEIRTGKAVRVERFVVVRPGEEPVGQLHGSGRN